MQTLLIKNYKAKLTYGALKLEVAWKYFKRAFILVLWSDKEQNDDNLILAKIVNPCVMGKKNSYKKKSWYSWNPSLVPIKFLSDIFNMFETIPKFLHKSLFGLAKSKSPGGCLFIIYGPTFITTNVLERFGELPCRGGGFQSLVDICSFELSKCWFMP